MILLVASSVFAYEKKAYRMKEDFGTETLQDCVLQYYYYIPCPTYSYFWGYYGWQQGEVIGTWFTIGDQSTGGYAPCDQRNCHRLEQFRVGDFAGYGTTYPGLFTVSFNIWCADENGCPDGPSLWSSGDWEMHFGWNYVPVDPPLCLTDCCVERVPLRRTPRILITATHVGSDCTYPDWIFDNISTPLENECSMTDFGGMEALYPRPSNSHYETMHSGYYGTEAFEYCPPLNFSDGRDTTEDASQYGCIELAWRVYLDCTGPCPARLRLWPPEITTYYPCGDSYWLDLLVEDVVDLGAFQICTGFDPSLVAFEDVTTGDFLGSTGRPVGTRDPISCEPSCHDAGTQLYFWTEMGPAGPSGNGNLARLYFSRLTDVAADDSACLEDWILIDTKLPPGQLDAVGDGAVIVHRPFCYGDFDDDGEVTIIDIAQVTYRSPCSSDDPCYSDTFDVNLVAPGHYCASVSDGWIGAADIQPVSDRLGVVCTGGGPMPHPLASAPQTTPAVKIWPESLVVCCDPGDEASFEVILEDGHNLGAFEFCLSYDPSVIYVETVQLGDLLASTGRSANAIGPKIDNELGRVLFGGWTLGENVGPDGDGTLAEVTVSIRQCEAATDMALSRVVVTDKSGWPATLGDITDGVVETHCGSSGVPEDGRTLPETYKLYPARPNPSSASTIIGFAIPAGSGQVPVEVVIYNVAGREVRTVVERGYGPGWHEVEWDGRDATGQPVAPGVYFCKMRTGGFTATRSLTVLR
jgi:hypothetical protein